MVGFQKPKTVKLSPYEKAQKAWEKKKVALLLTKGMRVVKKELKRAKKGKEKIKSLPKIKNLEARLKKVMYPYIKKRDGNTCISCGKKNLVGMDWHAGHYIKAELCNIVVRYDEWNINSQCSYCNKWRRGNTIAYRLAMIDKYGEKATNDLDHKYHSPLPMNFNEREWLLEMIAKYKAYDRPTED